MSGASRRAVPDLGASVCSSALSQGAIQKRVARVSEAIGAHDTAIGEVARTSLGNYMDETSGLLHGDRQWLWGMAHPAVAYFPIPLTRSPFNIVIAGQAARTLTHDRHSHIQCLEAVLL